MEWETSKIVTKILTRRELDKVPNEIVKKIEKYFEESFDEFLTTQALYDTEKRTNGQKIKEYEQLVQELTTKSEDLEVKLDASQQNTAELRRQLDDCRADVSRLQQSLAKLEADNIELKRQRDNLDIEKDALTSTLESRCAEVERLKGDVRELEKQLKAAINAKYDAIGKYDEIQSKEASLEYKERRMEQDKNILQSQLQSLTETYNSNLEELMAMRREKQVHKLDLESKLSERAEELNIANRTIQHLQETSQMLQNRLDELSAKRKAEADESVKVIDCYKNELLSKSKLTEIYKSDSEATKRHIDELTKTAAELKKMLNETVEEYGELETKMKEEALQHSEALKAKDTVIENLRGELKNANDLLKTTQEEHLEQAMERVAPSAAATSKLLKSNMTLTEIYTLYVKEAESLRAEKRENSSLRIQLNGIVAEIEASAPEINKRNIEYDKLINANAQIRQQLDNMITERVVEREELQDIKSKHDYLERENKRLKSTQADLARQVCFLLKEVEQLRGGITSETPDRAVSADMSASDVITKTLVTFGNVDELHENNQKLLLLVRDLSTKLEEFEETQSNFDQSTYEAKIAEYARRLETMEMTQRHQSQMIQSYIQQRDRYKLLYFEIMKDVGKPVMNISMDGSLSAEQMECVDEETPLASTSSISSVPIQSPANDKKLQELQEKLKEASTAMQQLKDEHNEYRKEKMANDKITNEQFNSMRNELRELTTTNCKLKNSVEFKIEKIKSLEKDLADFKKQISALEERNKVYDSTITKQEQTMTYLREQLFATQKQLSAAEVANKNLKQQCEILRDTETRLQTEREALYNERQKQNVVLNNLELLKCQLERSENEGRLRAEQRLDDTVRECSALRRHLQEEQDRFRELAADLERKTKTALQKASDEKEEVAKLQAELQNLRAELADKTKQVETMSHKLQEALTPNKSDNPVAKANKRAKELQVRVDMANGEIEHLKQELESCQTTIEQYSKMAKETECQLKDVSDRYNDYRQKTEKELSETKSREVELVSRVAELETEIKLQITDAQLTHTDSNEQLVKTQKDLKEAYEKISKNNIAIRDLREQVNMLTADLKAANEKYTNAIYMHTSDLQQFTECKEKLGKVEEQIGKLTTERDEAVAALKAQQDGYETTRTLLMKETEELKKRVDDLNGQNSALHDQLQSLSSTLTTHRTANESNAEDEASTSESPQNDSIVNRSITDEDGRDKLMSIIKYLRTEKDVALANVEVLRTENIRISAEMKVLNERLKQLSEAQVNQPSTSEENPLTMAKYEEVLRKVETLTAVTDSNRMLRDERDSLLNRIKELTERNTKVENELFPLQEQNRELTTKNEDLTNECQKLRADLLQWRQRANALVERSNKNPEEFKRIQNERADLAKMLTVEKEKMEKIEAELTGIKSEKSRIENELTTLAKAHQALVEEKRKLTEDISTAKQSNGRMSHEIIEVKAKLLQRDDEIKKMVEELTSKEALLTDSKNKEIQIRKIAKKYKDSFFELQNKEDERKADQAARPLEQQASDLTEANRTQAEKALNDRIKELGTTVAEKLEQNESLQAEIDVLRKRLAEIEAAHGNVLKELNGTIQTLTEEKKHITRELTVTKTQLLSCEQSRTDTDNLKLQNENRILRLEKDLADMDKENKENLARLTRENESLQLRLNRLQQGAKPTTSTGGEKSPSDAARTANVKPMAGPSTQQSATVTPRRGADTPLASIRPMSVQNSRTAAVLPTSQTANVASIHGNSSSSASGTASVTALVPPQQQVHTTGMTGEVMSTTSSHTDYMPATSSAASIVVAAVPPTTWSPLASNSSENIQEAESVEDSSSSSSNQVAVQQQAVALVSPRQHESAPQNIVAPQQVIEQLASTSASSSTSSGGQSVTMSTHNRATSTSNTVTTSQAGHKRPREVETDSTEEISSDHGSQKKPLTKRTRTGVQMSPNVQIGSSTSQESSCLDVAGDYQVSTSSQREDEENILIVDSDEEEPDDGPMEPDDAQFEDDNVEQFEEFAEQQIEGESNMYAENVQSNDTNEVEFVDDSSENPNASIGTSSASTSANAQNPDDSTNQMEIQPQAQETQQIQTISSGSDASGSSQQPPSTRNQATPTPTRQQQQVPQPQTPTQQTQQQQNLVLGYEESGDDSIVPSTPTLYVPRRADGFSEAVSSPQGQAQSAARFTFAESASRTNLASEGIDDTRVDLTQLDESASRVPTAPITMHSPRETSTANEMTSTSTASSEPNEPIAGTSSSTAEASIPEVLVSDDTEVSEFVDDNASTTEPEENKTEEIDDIEDEEGMDGVSSEGEKTTGGNETIETEEEGREAEATQAPSLNTRSRGSSGSRMQTPPYTRRGRQVRGRPQPIVWQDGHGQMSQQDYQQQQGSSNRSFMQQQQNQQAQRGQRNRRMRRPYNRY